MRRREQLDRFERPHDDFFGFTATELAPRLLGCRLERRADGSTLSGIIVETEAYTRDDPASHSFRGRTKRNWPMFLGGGYAYVYLIYGIHNCFNVTSGHPDSGEAVLVRAMQPVDGIDLMKQNRGSNKVMDLCSGPGKLCQAMGIELRHSGMLLNKGELILSVPVPPGGEEMDVTCRIGVNRGDHLMRRYIIRGSPWLSR